MNKLQTFLVVAEELNFSRAATKLNYSQPTVSKHIQSLEEELSVKLLDRKDGQYLLTPAGVKLYDHSININKELNSITQLSSMIDETFELKLEGHHYYCAKYFLPAITKMCKLHPGVDFVLNTSNNQKTMNNLLKNNIDIGILSGSILPKSFESVKIGYEDVGICIGKHLYRPELTTEDYIHKYPVLLDESDFYSTTNIFPYLTKAIKVVDTKSEEVIHDGLLDQECVGIMRLGCLHKDIERSNIHVLERIVNKDPIYLVTNKENMKQAHIRTFFDFLVKSANPKSKYTVNWV